MCRLPPAVEKEITSVRSDPPPRAFREDPVRPRQRVSFGRAGCAKRAFESGVTGHSSVRQYGQDCSVLKIIRGGVPGSVVMLMGILDGHGHAGRDVSRLTSEHAVRYMEQPENNRRLVEAVRRRSGEETDAFCADLFHALEELEIPGCTAFSSGGSTCTLGMIVVVDGRMVVVCANVGDSPAGIIRHEDGLCIPMSTDHSPENPVEYLRYRTACLSAGVRPGEAVYGRINCGGHRLKDPDGGYDPIRIYEPIDPDRPHHIAIDERNAVHMQTPGRIPIVSIGGSQSLRRMVFEEKTPTGWRIAGVLPEYYGQNWGSTIEGVIQMTRSIKDTSLKRRWGIRADPDVAIYELGCNEELTFFIGSDGFTDLFYFSEISSAVRSLSSDTTSGPELADALLGRAMEKARQYPTMFPIHSEFLLPERVRAETAAWDDVSLLVCRIQNNNLQAP